MLKINEYIIAWNEDYWCSTLLKYIKQDLINRIKEKQEYYDKMLDVDIGFDGGLHAGYQNAFEIILEMLEDVETE